MNKKGMNRKEEVEIRKNGEVRQHRQDKNSESVAIFLAPKYCDNIPLRTQARLPEAIIKSIIREY